jgi:ribosomal-protein-alanine N-acetyltransferase
MLHSIESLRWRNIRAVYQLEQDIFPKDAYPLVDLAFLYLTPHVTNLKAVDAEGALLGVISVADGWFPGRPAWVITLGVQRHCQRQGIGGSLLSAAENVLRAKNLRLTVRAGNQTAINLYEKAGYRLVYSHQRYYRDGEDGMVMEKTITP